MSLPKTPSFQHKQLYLINKLSSLIRPSKNILFRIHNVYTKTNKLNYPAKITFAGLPNTVQPPGTFFVTTLPAPITELSPIVSLGSTFAPVCTVTKFPSFTPPPKKECTFKCAKSPIITSCPTSA